MNSSVDQKDLVRCVRKYRQYDDELKDLNAKANKIREDRRVVEMEMGDILRKTQYSQIHKLDIADDKSVIKIQRPEQWSKPWSLSAKDMARYIHEYFGNERTPSPTDCIEFIVKQKRKDLIATEFSFSRMLRLEDNGNEH